jgi:hypothetical protein
MKINVPEICGEDLISRDAGHKIRDIIVSHWDDEVIEVEFGGKAVGSVSFFDEAIGLLLKREKKATEEVRRKLKFPDIKPEDRTLLNYVMSARVQEKKNKQE